jgi:hypothetical protein
MIYTSYFFCLLRIFRFIKSAFLKNISHRQNFFASLYGFAIGKRMKAIAPLILAAVLVICGPADAQEALNNDVSGNDVVECVADNLAEFADMLGLEQDKPRSSPKS